MAHFFCRLLPPRPGFAQDMTAAEMQAMQAHVGYWTALAQAGTAVVFGPVADPAGFWGLGVLEVAGEAEAQAITRDDPAILAAIGLRYEVLPMPRATTR
ncbi:MAG TPA: YciI family protein [Roseomonas sp.]|jgi:uncharacterized protein YciI